VVAGDGVRCKFQTPLFVRSDLPFQSIDRNTPNFQFYEFL
jgi:hypothetical protein